MTERKPKDGASRPGPPPLPPEPDPPETIGEWFSGLSMPAKIAIVGSPVLILAALMIELFGG